MLETYGGSETILVVDDEPAMTAVMTDALRRFGYTVLTASNGKEALDRVNGYDGAIDLVLLDMVMPEMSGEEAFPLIRAARPESLIVVCSGLHEAEAASPFPGLGADAFLGKPFQIGEVLRTIRSTLDGAKD